MALFGGGDAWSKDHEAILEHAKGLGYGRHSGKSYPSVDAPKSEWISWADGFNAWKDAERAKSTPIWATDPGDVAPSPPSSGGKTSAPYASNPFYPQLVQNYERPGLLDWSDYMPEGGLLGHEQYQPWTNPNNIASNIFDYQPPRIHAGGYGGSTSGGRSTSGGGSPSGVTTSGGKPTGRWVPETPITMSPNLNSFLGNVGADKAGTLGGLLDIATGTSVFSPSDYTMQQASDSVRDYAIQNLVKETPALQRSFDIASGQNSSGGKALYFSEQALDQAQRDIDDAVAAVVKKNPKAARVMYDGAQFIDNRPGGSGPFWSGPGSEEGGGA